MKRFTRLSEALRKPQFCYGFITEMARDGNFARDISMSELLAASMIHVDKARLPSQFAPPVEHALHELWERNIIGGDEPKPLQPVEKHQAQWGNAWLASRWILPPPTEIQACYATMLNSLQFQPHSHRIYKKGTTSTPLSPRENPTLTERKPHSHRERFCAQFQRSN